MLEQLLRFNLPSGCWFEFFSNLNPIAREEIEWELEDCDAYKSNASLAAIIEGHEAYIANVQIFEDLQYKNLLSLCYSLSPSDIIYDPTKEEYWRRVRDFLKQLFVDVPALAVEKEALLKGEYRKQIFKETKTDNDLMAVINKMSGFEEEEPEDFSAFQSFLEVNPHLFSIGHGVNNGRTTYTTIFKRRAILRNCLESIEYLLRRYRDGDEPSNWRHV